MSPAVTQPVLVYDRIAQNRRATAFLVVFVVASIAPFVAAISFGVTEWVFLQFWPRTGTTSVQPFNPDSLRGLPPHIRQRWEKRLREKQEMQLRRSSQEQRLRWGMMAIVAAVLLAMLALLFWTIASSPISRLLAMCGARPAGPGEHEARRLLENLSIGAGLRTPRLYVIDSTAPNAFAAGMDPARSVVAVTSGLLALLDRRELEGVLAHELAHIGNRDTRLNTIVAGIALFLRLPSLMVSRRQQETGYEIRSSEPMIGLRLRMFSLALIPIYIYVFFIAPLLAALMRAAISREREYLADADAALLTRYPEGLLRALAKIAGAGSCVAGAHPAIAHLYFADPSAAHVGVGIFRGKLLATHPPIADRIQRLAEFNGGIPDSALQEAVQRGRTFASEHPPGDVLVMHGPVAPDELSLLTGGNVSTRVVRVVGATAPVSVYENDNEQSRVVAHVAPGGLLIAFDDLSNLRQVVTSNQTFGYMSRSVEVEEVDALPAEVFDADARAAVESNPPPLPGDKAGLTPAQLAIAVLFALVVFGGGFLALMRFGASH